jgi:hypothetical protein
MTTAEKLFTFHLHILASRANIIICTTAATEHISQYLCTCLRRNIVSFVGIHSDAANDTTISMKYILDIWHCTIFRGKS